MSENDWLAKKAAMSAAKGGSSPEESWASFFAAFFDSLRRDLGSADDLEPAIRARQAELETKRREWVHSPQDGQSFMLTSMVLAAYEVIIQRADREAAVNALRHASPRCGVIGFGPGRPLNWTPRRTLS